MLREALDVTIWNPPTEGKSLDKRSSQSAISIPLRYINMKMCRVFLANILNVPKIQNIIEMSKFCRIFEAACEISRAPGVIKSNKEAASMFYNIPSERHFTKRSLFFLAAKITSSSLLKNPRQNESSLIQFFYRESVEARMRGAFTDQGQLFSYISPEARVRTDHPLRKIRELVRDVLGELNRSLSRLYACEGRPSIPPEQLLSALLLQVFYGIRSERQLMEQLDYNLLYRWFVGLSPDDLVWDPTVFTKNRDRLQSGEVFAKFMTRLLNHPQVKPLLSDEHFSVDGTLSKPGPHRRASVPRTAAAMMTAGPTSMGKSARTTRMQARPIPTADFTARRPGGRRSSATWATPRWRTGMGWRWPAWSRSPPAPLSGALRRRCSRPKSTSSADALRWAKTKPMTLLTM